MSPKSRRLKRPAIRPSRRVEAVAVGVEAVVVVAEAKGGGQGGERINSRDKWGANGDSKCTDKVSADGVGKKNGSWMMNCKSCGWNDTHTSGYHSEWSRNQATFQLPSTHCFWIKSGNTPSTEKAPTPAPGTANSGLPKGQLSG